MSHSPWLQVLKALILYRLVRSDPPSASPSLCPLFIFVMLLTMAEILVRYAIRTFLESR